MCIISVKHHRHSFQHEIITAKNKNVSYEAPLRAKARLTIKKTGEIKEICTEATLLCGAVNKRSGKTNLIINCKKYETRYFEFSKKKALNNISFDLYTKEDLNSFAETINIKDIVDQVKSNKLTSKTFTGSRKEQIMFAHLMFNNGVMMTSGCYAGNICSLIYFIAK